MLPPEFLTLLDKYEDDYDLSITKAETSENTLKVIVHIDAFSYEQSDAEEQVWEISIRELGDHRISFGYTNYIDLKDDHPLLWKYSGRQSELYFSGEARDPEKAFLEIYDLHLSLLDDYIPLRSFFNPNKPLSNIFSRQSGLFAKGPYKILTQFSDILVAHKLKTSIIGGDEDGKEGMPVVGPENYKVLLIGESYIVGKNFDFKRIM